MGCKDDPVSETPATTIGLAPDNSQIAPLPKPVGKPNDFSIRTTTSRTTDITEWAHLRNIREALEWRKNDEQLDHKTEIVSSSLNHNHWDCYFANRTNHA